MSKPKTERLLNLVWTLRATRQLLTKEQIRRSVAGYEGKSDDAFERQFERDKEELRELGVPIETAERDPGFSDEIGYRIASEGADLPDLDLTPEEVAVIGLAAHVWEHSGLAGQSGQAIAKLRAIGVDVDTDAVDVAEPRLSAGEAAFDAVWDAVHDRQPVTFDYQRPGGAPGTRHVEPWGVVNWRGRWYLGGWDRDREAPRLFRVGRITSKVAPVGKPGTYDVPAGTDWEQVARGLFGAAPQESAVLHVRKGSGHWLRRHADSVAEVDADFDEVRVPFGSADDLAGEVASYGADVVVLEPTAVRDAVIRRLRMAAS